MLGFNTFIILQSDVRNVGSTTPKGSDLYALCIMVPNEDFAELIRSGTPVDLDEEDLQVLNRSDFPKY